MSKQLVKQTTIIITVAKLLVIALLFLVTGTTLKGQRDNLLSISPDFTILQNNLDIGDFGFGYTIDHATSNIEFGLSILRRHYSRKGRTFSFEYGARLHKGITRLEVKRNNQSVSDISLHKIGISAPFRIFFDGFKSEKRLYKSSQSGLFLESLNSVHFRGDLAKNVYTSHLSLGVRTRGKRFYLQLTYGWPILTTETIFSVGTQGFAFTNSQRRFSFLTVGYTLH